MSRFSDCSMYTLSLHRKCIGPKLLSFLRTFRSHLYCMCYDQEYQELFQSHPLFNSELIQEIQLKHDFTQVSV